VSGEESSLANVPRGEASAGSIVKPQRFVETQAAKVPCLEARVKDK
jgi:hypothetical protein